MEGYYFLIIVLVILKILFWMFFCYVRAKRAQRTCVVQRVVVVDPQGLPQARRNNQNDRSAIINHAESISTSPPPYAQMPGNQMPGNQMPGNQGAPRLPSYNQAVGGATHPVPGKDYSAQPHPSAPAAHM